MKFMKVFLKGIHLYLPNNERVIKKNKPSLAIVSTSFDEFICTQRSLSTDSCFVYCVHIRTSNYYQKYGDALKVAKVKGKAKSSSLRKRNFAERVVV